MLEVGTNTYITTAEADEYIAGHYRSNNKDRKRWCDLSAEDKEVLLRQACAELDRLQWQGRKAIAGQALAFPRLPFQYGKTSELAPTRIKQAQAELALWLSDETQEAQATQRADLQAQGVTSFSLGDLSESYKQGGITALLALASPKVAALVTPYLSGGYEIC